MLARALRQRCEAFVLAIVNPVNAGWDQRANASAGPPIEALANGGPARLISCWSHPTILEMRNTLGKMLHSVGFTNSGVAVDSAGAVSLIAASSDATAESSTLLPGVLRQRHQLEPRSHRLESPLRRDPRRPTSPSSSSLHTKYAPGGSANLR